MADDTEVAVGAAQTRKGRTTGQRSGDRRREANKLIEEAKQLQEGERKCRGKVKLKDAAGNYLRDDADKVLTRPCKNDAIKGGTVCPSHGGKAPQVKAKALRRLRAMVEPSIIRLEALIHQDAHLPTALGAIKEVLNRAGGAATGPIDPDVGKADTRPVINIGIKVGGIDKKPDVKVGLLPTVEVVEAEHSDE